MSGAGGLLALLAFTACAASEPDFYLHQTGIVVDSAAPFTGQPDFKVRMESTLNAALEYWGGSWEDLAGRTITLEDEQYVSCGSSTRAVGCNDGNLRVSTRDIDVGTWNCVEATVLVHEVGHAVIGDPEHTDPRWMDFDPVLEKLDGRVGYAADGQVPCRLYLSVWRHVLNRR